MRFLSVNITIEILCFFFSVRYLKNDASRIWRSMMVFMLLTCLVEVAGRVLSQQQIDNNWIYNLYVIPEIVFNGVMFGYFIAFFKKNNNKRILLIIICLLLLFIYETFNKGLMDFCNLTVTVMSVVFVCISLIYYYYLLQDDQYQDLLTFAPFWWISGTIIFYFGTTVSNLYFEVFKKENLYLFTNRYNIYTALNIILYSFRTYSFVCRYRQRKSIHS